MPTRVVLKCSKSWDSACISPLWDIMTGGGGGSGSGGMEVFDTHRFISAAWRLGIELCVDKICEEDTRT